MVKISCSRFSLSACFFSRRDFTITKRTKAMARATDTQKPAEYKSIASITHLKITSPEDLSKDFSGKVSQLVLSFVEGVSRTSMALRPFTYSCQHEVTRNAYFFFIGNNALLSTMILASGDARFISQMVLSQSLRLW